MKGKIAIKELGKKQGTNLERWTKLQKTLGPFNKTTRRTKRIEKFRTLEDLNHGRAE